MLKESSLNKKEMITEVSELQQKQMKSIKMSIKKTKYKYNFMSLLNI